MQTNGYFHVNFPGLMDINGALRAQYQRLTSIEADLLRIPGTTTAQWDSDARRQFDSALTQLHGVIVRLGHVIGLADRHTAQAHDDWWNTELTNQRAWA